tara:strand:+ start:4886 stop:7195 length:2310 start_codon:yes stop_codon:yes gene_type:complete
MKRNKKKTLTNPTVKQVKNNTDVGVINLSTYTSPEVKEVANKDWVAYGEDNDYFQFLIDRYNGSPTNNAAINGISQAIYGKGLNATDADKKPDQYAQMISLFHKDCVRKVCYDLKLMGQAALQVVYSKDRNTIAKIEHFPIETLRAEKANEEGEIPAYYYFKDWAKIKPSDKPLRIPAYGMSKEAIEIYYIKPYRAGFYYYSPVDYQGGLQYAELEEEISNYHLNNIMNGLSPSMLINFNNGTPNQQERELIEQRIASKFSGTSNAGKFILAFNDNKDAQAEITPVQLSDAHNQYQFLSDESAKKIMVAHRVVSPMLLGIKDNSGLGNNADEIKTASLLMDNTVIRPFQELLIDCFDTLLSYNDISLNLYFITLQPLEFTEVDPTLQDDEEIEEETGVKMARQIDGQTVYETKEEAEEIAKKIGCKGSHIHEEDGKEYYMPCESHEDLIRGVDRYSYIENFKKIDGQTAYETKEEAEEVAEVLGCKGSHEHEEDGKIWHMPCKDHNTVINLKKPCEAGYEMIGMKTKNGKKVPNCVPIKNSKQELSENDLEKFIELGEDEEELLDNYDLIDVSEVDYETDDELDLKITELNKPKVSALQKVVNLVRTGDAYKNRKSDQDGTSKQDPSLRFLVRYQYAPLKKQKDTRDFCNAMVNAKKIYRKEDIIALTDKPVNKGFGKGGSNTYSIWLYKGGARCFHKWFRKTYVIKEDRNINRKGITKRDEITSTKAKSMGFRAPINDKLVPVAPRDMPFEGYTKAYWDKMGFKNTAK